VRNVEQHISRLLDRLSQNESHRLLLEFFGAENIFHLEVAADNKNTFHFTDDGIEAYKAYFDSNLPYDKYTGNTSTNQRRLQTTFNRTF